MPFEDPELARMRKGITGVGVTESLADELRVQELAVLAKDIAKRAAILVSVTRRRVRLIEFNPNLLPLDELLGEIRRFDAEVLHRLARVFRLGRVDADQPELLAVIEHERVAVDNARDGPKFGACSLGHADEDEQERTDANSCAKRFRHTLPSSLRREQRMCQA